MQERGFAHWQEPQLMVPGGHGKGAASAVTCGAMSAPRSAAWPSRPEALAPTSVAAVDGLSGLALVLLDALEPLVTLVRLEAFVSFVALVLLEALAVGLSELGKVVLDDKVALAEDDIKLAAVVMAWLKAACA